MTLGYGQTLNELPLFCNQGSSSSLSLIILVGSYHVGVETWKFEFMLVSCNVLFNLDHSFERLQFISPPWVIWNFSLVAFLLLKYGLCLKNIPFVILCRYVVEKDVKNNVVFVSRNYFSFDKKRRVFRVGSFKWLSGMPPSQTSQLRCKVDISNINFCSLLLQMFFIFMVLEVLVS